MLDRLAAHDWQVGARRRRAEAMGIGHRELMRRVEHLGFEGLLRLHG
ncbi:hypothetical protein [Streptomyces lydicus]